MCSKIEAGKLTLERIPFSLEEVLKNVRDIVGEPAEPEAPAADLHGCPPRFPNTWLEIH